MRGEKSLRNIWRVTTVNEIFKTVFDKEAIPEASKERIRKNILEFGSNAKKRKKISLRFAGRPAVAFLYSIVMIMMVGITVIAAVPMAREAVLDGLKSIFKSKENAVDEAYNHPSDNVKEYIHTIKPLREICTFAEESVSIEFVSYMSDENNIQILLQYAVDEKYGIGAPVAREGIIEGPRETYFADERWTRDDENHGYWMYYITYEGDGEYQLTLNEFVWGEYSFEGSYEVTFMVDSEAGPKTYEINQRAELDFKTAGPRYVDVKKIALSPLTVAIDIVLPENFSPNEAYDELGNIYFLDREGKKINADYGSVFTSMWETNGKIDSLGCALAREGSEMTLLVMLWDALPLDEISAVSIGENIFYFQK